MGKFKDKIHELEETGIIQYSSKFRTYIKVSSKKIIYSLSKYIKKLK